MTIQQETGWSVESKLLQYILKQLDRLIKLVAGTTGAVMVETDPIFNQWLTATPPAYPGDDVVSPLGQDLDVNGHNVDWGTILTTNSSYKGEIMSVTVDTNSIGAGCLLAQSADFHFDQADANSITTSYNLCLALEAGTGTKKVLLRGQYCNTVWNWSYGPIYLSETLGTLTQSLPITEDAVTACIGWALSATTIYFDPYKAWNTVYAETITTTTTTHI